MIGQEKLKAHFEKLIAFDKLPRFILLVGSQGSGKRTLANWIVQESDIDYEFITDQKVDSIRSVIESALTLRDRKIFVFPNAENMNLSAQNAFLKTLEEPPNNAYIIMTVNNLLSILGTIRSRASVFTMEGYTKDQLSEFVDFDEDIEIMTVMCNTPGMIKRYQSVAWQDMLVHCEKVVNNLGRISLANTFSILKNVKEEDYDLIIPTLQYVFWTKVRKGEGLMRQIKLLYDTQMQINHSSINVKNALEMMFVKLWEVAD